MIRMKSLENITKNTEQIIRIYKRNKSSEESSDGENIRQNVLIEGRELKIQHHDTSLKSQQKDS